MIEGMFFSGSVDCSPNDIPNTARKIIAWSAGIFSIRPFDNQIWSKTFDRLIPRVLQMEPVSQPLRVRSSRRPLYVE